MELDKTAYKSDNTYFYFIVIDLYIESYIRLYSVRLRIKQYYLKSMKQYKSIKPDLLKTSMQIIPTIFYAKLYFLLI